LDLTDGIAADHVLTSHIQENAVKESGDYVARNLIAIACQTERVAGRRACPIQRVILDLRTGNVQVETLCKALNCVAVDFNVLGVADGIEGEIEMAACRRQHL
jgi:hypothetical protein